MRNDTVWGSHIEIRAFTELYGINIYVCNVAQAINERTKWEKYGANIDAECGYLRCNDLHFEVVLELDLSPSNVNIVRTASSGNFTIFFCIIFL